MQEKAVNTIRHISTLLVAALVFASPILFFPYTSDIFDSTKRFAFIGVTAILLILWSVQTILTKRVMLLLSRWTVPFALFGVSTITTLILTTNNRFGSLADRGGFYIAIAVFVLIAPSLMTKQAIKLIENALMLSGVLVALVTIGGLFGISTGSFLNSSFNLQLPTTGDFALTGGTVLSLLYMAVVLALSLTKAISSRRNMERVLLLAVSGIFVAGIVVTGSFLLPGKPLAPSFLSFQDSWSIALDVMKNPKSAIFGVGSSTYANAFTAFRPVALNNSTTWFVRFGNARDLFLEMLTVQGVVGFAAFVLIFLATLSNLKGASRQDLPFAVASVVLLLIFIFFPPSSVLLVLLCALLVGWITLQHSENRGVSEKGFTLNIAIGDEHGVTHRSTFVSSIVGAIGVIVALVALFGTVRVFAADNHFASALIALRKNDAKGTYDGTLQAIQLNPFNESYHRSFALTNLSIAQSIAQAKGDKVSDADKQTVLTLVQQAINEAKTASSLDPNTTANWETLSSIYSSLVGSVQQADQWSVAAYIQAIQTAPSDPNIRFNLGSLYRQLQNNEQAKQMFLQTAQLKPDFANAYYNLADIAKSENNEVQQFAYLQQTLSVLKSDQPDYQKVKDQLGAVQKDLEAKQAAENAKTAKTTTGKTSAVPSPTPLPGPLNLPNDSGLASNSGVPEVPKQ
ncbi:MAG TPA: hypothetical protein VLH19_03755 [Patescibacteria group bacterium]|nr:hypothetical protein [Patescibacteria group bacterium]